jgi:segregation and condensation protein B
MNTPRNRSKHTTEAHPESGSVAAAGVPDEPAEGAITNGNGVDTAIAVESRENGHIVAEESVDRAKLKQALESLVFVSDRIVTAAQLGRAIKGRAALVRDLMAELMQDYHGRGVEIVEVGNGYQFRSAPACAPFVREFVAQKPVRLTRAQLETLALIAYRQPITRPEIDEIRGVDSGSAMRVLLERNLIKMIGRKDEPGRPLLYGSSPDFLEFFGMRSLKDLPTLREFTELNEENRALFKRKTGEEVGVHEAELAAAEEAARVDDAELAHVSDEDLAALAAEADRAEADSMAPASEPPEPGVDIDAPVRDGAAEMEVEA